jgi:PfaD family protein
LDDGRVARELTLIGLWKPGEEPPIWSQQDLLGAVARFREPMHVLHDRSNGRVGIGIGGEVVPADKAGNGTFALLASLPAIYPEWLGERSFTEVHQVRFPYVAGAMANAISSERMVAAMAEAGCLGFFGAAGLELGRIEAAIDWLQSELDQRGLPWGSNLIHSPHEPELEEAIADLYIRRGVRRVSASAFMRLTPAVVRYAYSGISQADDGSIRRRNHLFAKISRPEVAGPFMTPAPAELVQALADQGKLTPEEAQLAGGLPVAEDITVEADSGGHTDNQSLSALFPTILALRDQLVEKHRYQRPLRVGAAGGLGTPAAVAAAFGLGAAYVLTGTVNQACIESALPVSGRRLLANAGLGDVVMAPAADMFELGVEVQVLKRGTMFSVRARRLYELYRNYDRLEALPATEVKRLEDEIFRTSFEQAWQKTAAYWQERDPGELERAERDSKHKIALLFRSYLGQASRWAVNGDSERQLDFQIWCGPAIGAFNVWTQGTFLADVERRSVVQVARNLLEGAAAVTRAQQLRTCGVPVPVAAFDFRPRVLE